MNQQRALWDRKADSRGNSAVFLAVFSTVEPKFLLLFLIFVLKNKATHLTHIRKSKPGLPGFRSLPPLFGQSLIKAISCCTTSSHASRNILSSLFCHGGKPQSTSLQTFTTTKTSTLTISDVILIRSLIVVTRDHRNSTQTWEHSQSSAVRL